MIDKNLAIRLVAASLGWWAIDAWSEEPPFDCLIEASMTSAVSSAVPGVIERIETTRGARVKQGQIVARLQSGVDQAMVELARTRAQFTAELEAKRANHELAQRNLKRINDLHDKRLIPAQEQDKTQTMAEVAAFEWHMAQEQQRLARMELKRTEEMLAQRSIKSPIDGIVVDTLKSPGEYVEEHAIVKIARVDPLYVEVLVPLSDYGTIQPGMLAQVSLEPPIGGQYPLGAFLEDHEFVAGSGDLAVPPSQARDLARRLPAARLVEIEGGHLVHEERPDVVAELVLREAAIAAA